MCANVGRAALASLLLLGCTGLNPLYADATGGQAESGPGTTTRDATGHDPSSPTDPSLTTTPTTQSTLEPTDGSSDATTGMGPGTSGGTSETATSWEESFGATTDGPPTNCSTYEQDCPLGEKCMPWATDGGVVWNAHGCFPLDPTNLWDPGEACLVNGSPTSGMDDCDEYSMCWDVNNEDDLGTCVAFCRGSPETPTCDDPNRTCVQSNDGVIALCLPLCDPLLQGDCATGSACLPTDNGFACAPDASGPGGAVGDVCEFLNDCDPGNICFGADALLNGCGGLMCCTSFCDLEGGNTCENPSVCVAYYDEGGAPLGYDNLGYCGVPA